MVLNKRISLVLLLALLILFLLPSVMGIGMYGSNLKTEIIFEPGLEKTMTYKYKSSNSEIVVPSAEGKLSEYITIEKEYVEGTTGTFDITLTLPDELGPGYTEARICAAEGTYGGSGAIAVRTKSCALLFVFSLYEGKYLVGSVSADESTSYVEIDFNLENKGNEDIIATGANVEIFDPEGNSVGYLSMSGEGIASFENVVLSEVFDIASLSPGIYSIEGEANGDGETFADASGTFRVGSEDVIVNGYTKDLVLGGIQEFKVNLESNWGDEMEVYPELVIEGQSERAVESKIGAWGEKEFELYVKTDSLEEGSYEAKLNLYVNGEFKREESIELNAIVGEISEESYGVPTIKMLILGGLALVVIFTLTYVGVVYLKNQREEDDDEEDEEDNGEGDSADYFAVGNGVNEKREEEF